MGQHLQKYEGLLFGLGVASLAFVIISLALLPILIARLPPDHFARERREPYWLRRLSPALRVAAIVAKNMLGLLVSVCGVLMLVLPGQGLLTLLIGLSLLDFPGKHRLERWLLARPSVMRGLNWLRRKLHKPPFSEPTRA